MASAKKQSKTKAAIKKEIIDLLNTTSGKIDPKPGKHSCGMTHHNALVLATCANNKPRATVLEFLNEGLTIYIIGEPGGKIANIKRNPHVSATVYEQPMNHSKRQKSLQIFGVAELITIRNNPRLFKSRATKYKLLDIGRKIMMPFIKAKNLSKNEAEAMLKKGIESLSIIKITPNHIILKTFNPDFSLQKFEWKD
jgi:hypothetical protein